jgi:hypothetical protein
MAFVVGYRHRYGITETSASLVFGKEKQDGRGHAEGARNTLQSKIVFRGCKVFGDNLCMPNRILSVLIAPKTDSVERKVSK